MYLYKANSSHYREVMYLARTGTRTGIVRPRMFALWCPLVVYVVQAICHAQVAYSATRILTYQAKAQRRAFPDVPLYTSTRAMATV